MITKEVQVIEKEEEELYYFKELSPGDIFKDDKNDYYIRVNNFRGAFGNNFFNVIKLETGSFSYFNDESRVYPYKIVKILVYK